MMVCVSALLRGSTTSCALAWAVKEVPDSEAGPPAAELPRHTDIDPFAQGEARKARAQSQVPVSLRWGPIASQSIGNPSSRVDGRLIRHKESGEEAPTMRAARDHKWKDFAGELDLQSRQRGAAATYMVRAKLNFEIHT